MSTTEQNIFASAAFHKSLEPYSSIINLMGIEIKRSNLFQFEVMYDACLIETHEEIKIPSGEWIHGVSMPNLSLDNIEPISPYFSQQLTEWNKYLMNLRFEMFMGFGLKKADQNEK